MDRLFVLGCVIAQSAGDFDDIGVILALGVVGHDADVQADDVTTKKSCEIGDFFHLLESRRAGLGRHQADGPFDRRDVRIALAIESSEDTSQFDPVLIELLEEGFGRRGGSSRGMRRVKLD